MAEDRSRCNSAGPYTYAIIVKLKLSFKVALAHLCSARILYDLEFWLFYISVVAHVPFQQLMRIVDLHQEVQNHYDLPFVVAYHHACWLIQLYSTIALV